MLPSTRNNVSSKILKSNSARVMLLWILLLATAIMIPQGNLFSGALPSAAYAQQLPEYGEQSDDEEKQESQQQDGETSQQVPEYGQQQDGATSDQAQDESTQDLIVEITSNRTRGVAPATFEFEADVTGGTQPYTYSWDFDDGSEESDEEAPVEHTFDEAGTYNVTLTVTDAADQTATDILKISVIEEDAASPQSDESAASPQSDESAASPQSDVRRLGDLKALQGIPGLDGVRDIPISGTGGGTDENPGTGGGTDENPGTGGGTDENPGSNSTDENPPPDNSGQGGVDKFGIEEIYPTASNGPVWYVKEVEDPTTDGYFYYGMYRTTTVKNIDKGIWEVDARSGTEEHGIRMHVDSPSGKWKNEEITGYFKVLDGSDQITMIARHGPSYHDNNGCEAYGYYALTAVDGEVYFKKKLYHYDGGYTKRLAQVDALDNILNDWIGMKFVVYDLPNGDVKLELWIDEGDMTNNWKKETELVDDGGLNVEGGDDCGRQSNHIIKDGTRSSYRVDDSLFDFKKLSVREIRP
jgi:PKD repeat protein